MDYESIAKFFTTAGINLLFGILIIVVGLFFTSWFVKILRKSKKSSGYMLSEKRLNTMVRWQYLFYINLNPNYKHLEEIRAFDRRLKKEYPEFYHQSSKKVKLMRATGFLTYYPMCRIEAKR